MYTGISYLDKTTVTGTRREIMKFFTIAIGLIHGNTF